MNITAVSHSYPTYHNPASGKIIKDELDLLSKEHTVHLIVPAVRAPSMFQQSKRADQLLSSTYHHSVAPYLSIPRRYFPSFIRSSLQKAILSNVPHNTDIIHIHWLYPNGLAIPYLKKQGFKVVLTIHGTDWDYTYSKNRLQPFVRETLEAVDAINVVGHVLQQKIISEFPSLIQKIQVVHHGIDTELFKPSSISNRDTSRLKLLSVANLFEVKGLDVLIDALGTLPSSLKYKVDLTIIAAHSDRTYERSLMSHIDQAEIKHQVQIIKSIPQHELVSYYQQADIFILPSRFEAFGLALAEAAACGLPCIATKSGGPEEILMDPQMGELVEKDNPRQLSEAIIKVWENSDSYSAERIRGFIIQHFSKQRKLDNLTSLYQKLVSA